MDRVTWSVGTLYYWTAKIAGQPVKALVDSGSSASFLLFELLKNHQESQLTEKVMNKPDEILRDYSQQPIRIRPIATVELEVGRKGSNSHLFVV